MSFFASERWVHRLRSVTVTPPYRHKSHRFKFISAILTLEGGKFTIIFYTFWARFDSPSPTPAFSDSVFPSFRLLRFPEKRSGGGKLRLISRTVASGWSSSFLPSDTKKNQQQQQTQSIVPSTNNETFPIWCMMLKKLLGGSKYNSHDYTRIVV